VREARDIKSAKVGVVHQGEQCTQTGPWRADPTGRVRMPVSGPRGVSGWLTLDERSCRNANGELGAIYLSFVDGLSVSETSTREPEQVVENKTQTPAISKASAYELEDILDMFGGDDSSEPDERGESNAAEVLKPAISAKKAWRQRRAAEREADEAQDIQNQQDESNAAQESSAYAKDAPVLDENQRKLRNIQKKLREFDGKGGKEDHRAELLRQQRALEEEMAQDAQASSAQAGKAGSSARRRKKPASGQKGSSKVSSKQSPGVGSASLMLVFVVSIVAVSAVYILSFRG